MGDYNDEHIFEFEELAREFQARPDGYWLVCLKAGKYVVMSVLTSYTAPNVHVNFFDVDMRQFDAPFLDRWMKKNEDGQAFDGDKGRLIVSLTKSEKLIGPCDGGWLFSFSSLQLDEYQNCMVHVSIEFVCDFEHSKYNWYRYDVPQPKQTGRKLPTEWHDGAWWKKTRKGWMKM